MDIKREVKELEQDMVALRRTFHRHPELGLHEVWTSGVIERYLKDLGLEVRRCMETGIIGILKGGQPGKTILLRCDIDALPVTEQTGLPFASETPGVMHACGHDGHMALHLTTARLLSAHRDEIKGTVIFLFQPNEEDAGAELMIEAGALDDHPDAVCGFHLWSPLPTGTIGLIPGPIRASSWYFKVTIHGLAGHGGAPHTAVNPIDAAGHVLMAIKSLHSLECDATKPSVISVCKIHGGTKEITVPETVEIEGSIRCLHDGDAALRDRFRQLITTVCDAYRCTCDIQFKCGNSLLNNDKAMTQVARQAAINVVGEENILTDNIAVMLGDDFAEFSNRVPGVYYFIGTRNEEVGSVYEHHHHQFVIDEASLSIGVQMQAEIVMDYLKQ